MRAYRGEFLSVDTNNVQQSVQVFLCDSPLKRLRGLLGREHLLEEGLFWLKPCSAVHTWFMSAGIDLAYLDENQKILKLVARIDPWRLSACSGAKSVLELPRGRIAELALNLGDRFLCHR